MNLFHVELSFHYLIPAQAFVVGLGWQSRERDNSCKHWGWVCKMAGDEALVPLPAGEEQLVPFQAPVPVVPLLKLTGFRAVFVSPDMQWLLNLNTVEMKVFLQF